MQCPHACLECMTPTKFCSDSILMVMMPFLQVAVTIGEKREPEAAEEEEEEELAPLLFVARLLAAPIPSPSSARWAWATCKEL